MKNWQCKKCGTHIKIEGTPNYGGCPKGGNHDWSNIGDVGDLNYQCKKCALLVQTKSTPNYGGCPSGGNHDWKKL